MSELRKLIQRVAQAEQRLQSSEFIAPCLAGERVATTLGGLVYYFQPEPFDFEGWGIFLPEGSLRATLVGEADPSMIKDFLRALPRVQLHLCKPLSGARWLAAPADAASAARLAKREEIVVNLVREGDRFDRISARLGVGGQLWFDEIDPLAEPQHAEWLRQSLAQRLPVDKLQRVGLTPAQRSAYALVW